MFGTVTSFVVVSVAWTCCLAPVLVAGQAQFPLSSSVQLSENLTVLRFHDISKDTQSVEEPLRQTLAEGDHFVFGVEVVFNGETYPDIVLTLNEDTETGDTNIYCHPRHLAVAVGPPGPQFSVWSSDHTKGEDVIFISRKSELYVGEVKPNVTVEGKEYPAARFVCVLSGSGAAGTESSLDVDVLYAKRSLVESEQEAMKEILSTCCAGARPCPVSVDSQPSGGDEGDQNPRGNPLDFCHFPGNICDARGRLIRLFMQSFNLKCDFPVDAIKQFKQLRKLDLDSNLLTGDILEIAEELSTIKNLKWLSMNGNDFTGELADGGEGGICELAKTQVEFVSLNLNRIAGSVPECVFGEGSSFTELHLDGNNLTGSLPEFSSSSPLQTLSISGSDLTGMIPESLGELKKLRGLRLSRNKLEGSIPSNLASGESLSALHLDHNNLEGRIPASLASSTSLRDIQLFENNLTGLPEAWELGQVDSPSLHFLDLGSNQIEAAFPVGLGSAQNLSYLNVAHNKFSGSFPDVEGLFPKTSSIILSYNEFTGVLPTAFSTLGLFSGTANQGSGFIFTVAHNNLSGDIPDFLYDSNRPPLLGPNVFLGGNRFTCPEPNQLHTVPDLVCFVKCADQANIIDRKDSREGVSKGAAVAMGVLVVILASVLLVLLITFFVAMRKKKLARKWDNVLGEDTKDIEVGVRRR